MLGTQHNGYQGYTGIIVNGREIRPLCINHAIKSSTAVYNEPRYNEHFAISATDRVLGLMNVRVSGQRRAVMGQIFPGKMQRADARICQVFMPRARKRYRLTPAVTDSHVNRDRPVQYTVIVRAGGPAGS